jgi:hypothetical protein
MPALSSHLTQSVPSATACHTLCSGSSCSRKLVEVGELEVGSVAHASRCGSSSPSSSLQQRGLARAVGADQPDRSPRMIVVLSITRDHAVAVREVTPLRLHHESSAALGLLHLRFTAPTRSRRFADPRAWLRAHARAPRCGCVGPECRCGSTPPPARELAIELLPLLFLGVQHRFALRSR